MKDIVISDITGDGTCELVISLTDRVVRTYKWISSTSTDSADSGLYSGVLVSIDKWEFASQIGTVTVNYDLDGSPALLGNVCHQLLLLHQLYYFSCSARRCLHETKV